MDEATAEDKDTYIAMLNEGSAQLEQTIRNLNEIITVNDNAIEPKERRCLQEEVVKALRTLNGLILKHQIGVNVSIGENLYVYAIPAYLDSILLNLISNAIKYRSPDRLATVDIFAGQEANYTFLAVQDNGLGLDLNRHGHKLFGLYKKFHGNTDARGFGLYITKTQVEAMGGRIEVASEVGKGSIFKVYFHEKN
jgi:K+-sensing histidine kinase KdpD